MSSPRSRQHVSVRHMATISCIFFRRLRFLKIKILKKKPYGPKKTSAIFNMIREKVCPTCIDCSGPTDAANETGVVIEVAV